VAAVFAGLAASLAGVWAITADLKPALDAAAKVLSGLMNSLGRTIQALMPAIQPVIDFVGRLAGELAGLIDMGLQVVEALAPVIQVVTSVAVQILEALKPAIAGGLVVAIAGLAASLAALVVPMLPLIGVVAAAGVVFTALAVAVGKAIKVVIGWIEQLFGIDLSLKAPEGGVRDDTGLAARQTSTTSTEALLQKAREQAFMVGGNAPQKPEVARLDTLNNKLDALTSNLKTWIVDAAPAAIGKAVGAFVTGGAGDFAKGVAGGGGTTPAAVAGGLVSGLAPGAGLVAGLVDGARRLMP
jgi:hypothetical protein